ncbi:uncharacterized protein LOC5519041 isoform X1 [Nematostella vectensis]|uniref:uncharacterized protein LOC5519041 isoform X1 n=1 Tax=Nematostella vectensis TaxID=45351 RepID=UPI0020774E46|nr:uncharacterized protein LOC5519041 isoform X1 [Nematostella vectensis]
MKIPYLTQFGILLFLLLRNANGECDKPLGMKSRPGQVAIKDEQITASSEDSDLLRAALARLDEQSSTEKRSLGGWCAEDSDRDPYLQVDLLRVHTISGLATQGVAGHFAAYAMEYTIEYSYDTFTWYDVKEKGASKVFPGNRNSNIPKSVKFSRPLTARSIRLHIKRWSSKKCLRMELYGCEPIEDCETPVGMENRVIPDDHVTASSHWNNHEASNARLKNEAGFLNGTFRWGGWCTDNLDKHQYIQVDLGHVRAVSAIATQGYMRDNFVKQYRMNYSIDGQEWKPYVRDGGSKIFLANWDNDTIRLNTFTRIFARFIRLNPIQWNSFGYVCMRIEIYECLPTRGSVPDVSPPGATFKVNRTSDLNLTCQVSGQQGAMSTWLKNGIPLAAPYLSSSSQLAPVLPDVTVNTQNFGNGTTLSHLSLRNIKYRDSGSVISCTAGYPDVAINTSRNVHVFVIAPRPMIKISNIKSRSVLIDIIDQSATETMKYFIRFRAIEQTTNGWTRVERMRAPARVSLGRDIFTMVLDELVPYTTYISEVAPFYRNDDTGPYSEPIVFTTDEDVPSGPPRDVIIEPLKQGSIRVSWSVPDLEHRNGRIVKYEVQYALKGSAVLKTSLTQQLQKEINGLDPKGKYKVSVRAHTRKGPGPYSQSTLFDGVHAWKPKSETTKRLEQLSKVTVTDVNAGKVTAEVKNITAKKDSLKEEDILLTSYILKKVVLTNTSSETVGNSLLTTLSNVMDVDSDVLRRTQEKYNTSARFVEVLEVYIDKGGKFSIDTPNIAVHTQKIKSSFHGIHTTVTTTDNKINITTSTGTTPGARDPQVQIDMPSSMFPNNDTSNETVIFVYYKNSKLFKPNFRILEVCRDGFTSRERRFFDGDTLSVERVERDIITESSPVIAASLKGRHVASLSKPVTITFKMPPDMILDNNSTKCRWWDFNANGGMGDWSAEGCQLEGIYNHTVVCQCDHMTNFAALVDVYGPSTKPCGAHELALSLIAYVGCGLSILGLALTIFTYAFFQKLRKEIAAKILLHLCSSLLCVLIVFTAGVDRAGSSNLSCQVVAVLIHYFLLVAFMWMLIEAYFMYLAFVKVWRDHGDYVMWKCAAIGWGLPAAVVVATIAVDKESYGGEHYCRLKDLPFFVAFLAPVVTIVLVNTVIFTIIMYKLSTRPLPSSADKDRGHEGMIQLRRALGILILVGLTWMFGFFAISTLRLAFTYLFAVCNCLQGFSIFMFYCVTQRNVRECWWALVTCNLKSLQKKHVYTDSYDRRRLSSASKAQHDAMRARTNTALTQIMQMPMRDVYRPEEPIPEKSSENPNYEGSLGEEPNMAADVTVYIEAADNGSHYSINQDISRQGSISGSFNTSFRSREPSGSRGTVNSVTSTPRLQVTRFKSGNSVGALSMDDRVPAAPYTKNTLTRTTSHQPAVYRPPESPSFLRRTKSASSLCKDNRFSTDSLISLGASTSSESLSSDTPSTPSGLVGKRLLRISDMDRDKYGELIVSPNRGSVRGIVGHVENKVDEYDDLIEKERKRSVSLPAQAYSYVT